MSVRKKKIYISGAITNTPNYLKHFNDAESRLTKLGYSVVNPAKVNSMLPIDTTYDEYMKMSFCMLDMCDYIYMLKGWEYSNGANLECEYAIKNRKGVIIQ